MTVTVLERTSPEAVRVPLKRPCGMCSTNDHELCPGSIGGWAKVWVCQCSCPTPKHRCVRCGTRDDSEIAPNSMCFDRDGCDARIARRLATNPDYQRMLEITARSAIRVAEENAARPVRSGPTKSPVATGEPRGKCHCGCGDTTKGGRFCMGHDARLRSNLAKLVAAATTPDGPALNALAELIARGGVWEAAGAKAVGTRAGLEHLGRKLAEGGDKFVIEQVKARIGG